MSEIMQTVFSGSDLPKKVECFFKSSNRFGAHFRERFSMVT